MISNSENLKILLPLEVDMIDDAIQYNIIQYGTIQYNMKQYDAIQYNTTWYNTTQYNTYDTMWYNTIQYDSPNLINCKDNLSHLISFLYSI